MIGVVLAAGYSSRFESCKQVHDLNGQPMIKHILNSLKPVDEVAIVVGHYEDEVKAALRDEDVVFLRNENYSKGIGSSVKVAMDYAFKKQDDLLITLSDIPMVKEDDYLKMIDHLDKRVLFSTNGVDYGVPCIIPKEKLEYYLGVLKQHGLKRYVDDFDLVKIEKAFLDIDFKEDLNRIVL